MDESKEKDLRPEYFESENEMIFRHVYEDMKANTDARSKKEDIQGDSERFVLTEDVPPLGIGIRAEPASTVYKHVREDGSSIEVEVDNNSYYNGALNWAVVVEKDLPEGKYKFRARALCANQYQLILERVDWPGKKEFDLNENMMVGSSAMFETTTGCDSGPFGRRPLGKVTD